MRILICGAGGFIGSHLSKRLAAQGHEIYGVDLKRPEFTKVPADSHFLLGDLRNQWFCDSVFETKFDEIYQLAAEMGGAGYTFSGENDADIMHNSALVNLNVIERAKDAKVFFSSSACIYPDNVSYKEESAYPASPDSDYGWEKLFSEHLYMSFARNKALDARIARFHNVYGPEGTFSGGREKSPAALCRKVLEATKEVEIWGSGDQVRTYLFIDDCLDGIAALMASDFKQPINLGSTERVTIDGLAKLAMSFEGKHLGIKHIPGPTGVSVRFSDNTLAKKELNWDPKIPLKEGLLRTYLWIKSQR